MQDDHRQYGHCTQIEQAPRLLLLLGSYLSTLFPYLPAHSLKMIHLPATQTYQSGRIR